jgi:hypothetical protein
MTKILSTTLTSNGNVTFTSIPQTYTDLMVKISAADSSGNQTIFMLVNNDSGSNYSEIILKAYASANTTGSISSPRANIYSYALGDIPTVGSLIQNNAEIYISNYTSSNYKTMLYDSVQNSNSVITNELNLISGLWSSSSAITSLTFYSGGASLATSTNITLYGIKKYVETGTGSKATGGTVTTSGGYTIHTFYSSGIFTPAANLTADYLVVAGGGGGGGIYYGGGGGAGGLRSTVTATGGGGTLETALSLTSGTGYSVIVGAGGNGGTSSGDGSKGTNSSFSSIISTGGGLGRTEGGGLAGVGGSGAGGCPSATVGYRAGGAGTTNQGYAGGSAAGDGATFGGGGGGGAGGVGGNNAATVGGNGGIGVATTISGTSTYYAGGAGGQSYFGPVGAGGKGGGGQGAKGSAGVQATEGAANTGGGGGGGSHTAGSNTNGRAGGSGIVIIRYTT